MAVVHDLNAKLKALRDRLAAETTRARTLPRTPSDLQRRLQTALEAANGVCALTSVMRGAPAAESPVVVVARGNALIQAHLALHDWDSWLAAGDPEAATRPASASTRRRHERYRIERPVKLAQAESEGTVRDISVGGLYVTVAAGAVMRVAAQRVVEVSLDLGGGRELLAGARVLRCDARGVGLRWVEESPRVRAAVESLVANVAPAPAGR
jgi:hypothetical protein